MIKVEVNKSKIEAEILGTKPDIMTELVLLCRDVINQIADDEKDKRAITRSFSMTFNFSMLLP